MISLSQHIAIWLFGLEHSKKRLIQIIFDGLVSLVATLLAFFIRLETGDYLYRLDTYIGVLIAVVTSLSTFTALGQYNNITRHVTIVTAHKIAIGSVVTCTILFFCIPLFDLEIPRSVPLIYAMLLWFFSTAVRFLIRALAQNIAKDKAESVAIYGTDANSIQLIDSLRKSQNYTVKMLIDDNAQMQGKNIGGIEIYGLNKAAEKIRNFEIKILLLGSPSNIDVLRSRIFDNLSDYPLKVKTIPSVSSLISGQFEIAELRDIKIDDLLGREPVHHNFKLMGKTITEKTVLVTGAGGSIGSELCRQIILWKPKKLIMLDVSEFAIYNLLEELDQHLPNPAIALIPLVGSVQNRLFIEKIFSGFAVDTIYHAAAYKHVPLMEQNVMQCIANNVFGTFNMAELAIAAKVKHFILISTDKAVNPANVMGASKRLAEVICQDFSAQTKETCFSIVRFGNVLGSSGSVVPLFKKQIENGGPVTLTHVDVSRYFMTIPEAAQLVIQAGSIAKGGDVFVLDMGEPVKIIDLAKKMVTLSGLQPVLDSNAKLQDHEILISVTGLRPGEKLFEELAYNANLKGTVHPRINTAVEKLMKHEEVQSILAAARNAILDNDHHGLFQAISKVASGCSNVENSTDVFVRAAAEKSDKIKVMRKRNKNNSNLIPD